MFGPGGEWYYPPNLQAWHRLVFMAYDQGVIPHHPGVM